MKGHTANKVPQSVSPIKPASRPKGGPTVPIKASLAIGVDEKLQLAEILGCDRANLDRALAPFATAALEELARMFLGQKVFTRGSDMREYRLFLLIRHAFGNRVPTEQQVCELFQTTLTESRSLIRSVLSKYQYELQEAILGTLKDTMSSAKKDEEGEEYYFTADNASIVEELNRLLAGIDGTLPQVAKKRGTVSTYELKPSSCAKLRKHLGLDQGGPAGTK